MLDRPSAETHRLHLTRRGRIAIDAADEPPPAGMPSGRAMLVVLQRRKWTLIAFALLIPLLAGVAISRMTPRYTATGTLIYDASEYNPRELQSILRTDPTTDAVMASQAEILRSLRIVELVATRLDLFNKPEFNRALRPHSLLTRIVHLIDGETAPAAPIAGPVPDDARNGVLLAAQDALSVVPFKGSRVLEVSFTAEDRVLAAAAVNMAMDAYVKDQLSAKFRAVHRANDWLVGRVAELRHEYNKPRTTSPPTAPSMAWRRACTPEWTRNSSAISARPWCARGPIWPTRPAGWTPRAAGLARRPRQRSRPAWCSCVASRMH